MLKIINNRLRWDGEDLGSNQGIKILDEIKYRDTKYTRIYMPEGWSEKIGKGIICCVKVKVKDLFPCIVEEIKRVFGVTRRGTHRITIKAKEYIIYYVPISTEGDIIWEMPIRNLDKQHENNFRREVQKIIVFCEILALCGTSESKIKVRYEIEGKYTMINVNGEKTSITKEVNYDYSIITKNLLSKWFGDDYTIREVLVEMIKETGENTSNIGLLSTRLRSKIDKIIMSYDRIYIWYSYFIIERVSRYLLAGGGN